MNILPSKPTESSNTEDAKSSCFPPHSTHGEEEEEEDERDEDEKEKVGAVTVTEVCVSLLLMMVECESKAGVGRNGSSAIETSVIDLASSTDDNKVHSGLVHEVEEGDMPLVVPFIGLDRFATVLVEA